MTANEEANKDQPKITFNIVAHWTDEDGNKQLEKFEDTKEGLQGALGRAGISDDENNELQADYLDDEDDDGETELSEFQMRMITTVWGSDGDELEASLEAGISLSQQPAFKEFWADLERKYG